MRTIFMARLAGTLKFRGKRGIMISLDFTPTQFCNLVRMHSLLWGGKTEAKLRQAESWPAAAISPIEVGQALFTFLF